jgi:hypothetical protein
MTKAQYNRDVKRLRKAAKDFDRTAGLPDIAPLKTEWWRLYNADRKFEFANKESVLTLLRVNLRYRFTSLHNFGIYIEI